MFEILMIIMQLKNNHIQYHVSPAALILGQKYSACSETNPPTPSPVSLAVINCDSTVIKALNLT